MNSKPEKASDSTSDPLPPAPAAPQGRRSPWLVFVVPFVVYLSLTQLEPAPPERTADTPAAATGTATESDTPTQPEAAAESSPDAPAAAAPGLLGLEYRHYPLVYTFKIAVTFGLILLAWPGYREVPFRVTLVAPLVGAIGAPIWIGLCRLETSLLPALGLDWLGDTSARTGFNPLAELRDNPAWAYGFLAIRFFGLVVVVAIIEEFFLRGFLIRFLTRGDWWNVPLGTVTAFPLVAMTVAAALSHPPSEYLAAVVWFSLLSWLMLRTKSLWDCVIAHGVTNLLLGIYVVTTGQWEFM
ncbi:MAG: CAAX prenyl protease-related protein [Planctomycetaceae bacterium]|nr:CAAX prenyl protease-related protein [Planctomycetaceae bacterium]